MAKKAVIRTGGQQFLVSQDDELVVQKIDSPVDETIQVETLGILEEGKAFEVGDDVAKTTVNAKILSHMKGDKIRVAKFKSKVRYRKVRGFRPQLTRIKITAIA